MSYTRDKTAQLADAVAKGYGARAAQLRREGTPTAQHNVNVTTTSKKAAAKKTVAKKTTTKKS